MSHLKVVARFADGRIVKGSTSNFSPDKTEFHLVPAGADAQRKGIRIPVRELKAVFFVKDFIGNAAYRESTAFPDRTGRTDSLLEVEFLDGEVMVGTVSGYGAGRQGFFLFPSDPENNNLRVFVVSSAVKEVAPVAASGFCA